MMVKERFCWYCGATLGEIDHKHYDRGDTCGKAECDREARDQLRQEREEAHERLDRDLGWN